MEKFKIVTDRLIITEFEESMAESVHLNSLNEDNRRFVPDEVFETVEEARVAVRFLIERYKSLEGPFVYPILLKNGENIGYVQAVKIDEGWEVGYHIAADNTGKGYATEALRAFVPVIMKKLGIESIWGICRGDNIASQKVLEKCSFVLVHKSLEDYKGQNQEIYKYFYSMGK